MNLAEEVFTVYQELYNQSTEEFWEEHSRRLGYSVEILREMFGPKTDELRYVREFIEDYLHDNWILRHLITTLEEQEANVLEVEILRDAFRGIIDQLESEDIEELMEDDAEYYFSAVICESMLMALQESLETMIREGHSINLN